MAAAGDAGQSVAPAPGWSAGEIELIKKGE